MDKQAADGAERCSVNFQRATALFGLLLLGATWPLWRVDAAFPQVPLVAWAVSLPAWIDRSLLFVLVACLAAMLAAPLSLKRRQAINGLAAAAWLVLFTLNQHRLQPWAYQFCLLSLIFATADARRIVHLARALAASIYIYSAVGKFNEAFYSGIGATFLNEGLRWLTNTDHWPETVQALVVRGMPVGELAIGLGLAAVTMGLWHRNNRRDGPETLPSWLKLIWGASVLGSLLMHLTLLGVLGDWGLGHHWGVLLWNTFFIVQAVILFGKPTAIRDSPADQRSSAPRMIVFAAILMALVMPATARFGWWDHWLSWGLYSPGHGVVQVFVRPSAAAKLPDHIRAHVEKTSDEHYLRIDLNQWSLAALRVPVYPSDRFQAGVTLFVAKLPSMDRAITAGWSPPGITERKYETFTPIQLPRLPSKFTFNAKPRHHGIR